MFSMKNQHVLIPNAQFHRARRFISDPVQTVVMFSVNYIERNNQREYRVKSALDSYESSARIKTRLDPFNTQRTMAGRASLSRYQINS